MNPKPIFVADWTMQQAWRTEPEPDFLPARVRVGWSPDAMLVEAELPDRDIFNPVKEFNQAAFTSGDVFEIFLRPEQQESYFEFHITPDNQLFQLRFANAQHRFHLPATGTLDEQLAELKIWKSRISTTTRVDATAQRWFVSATIPFAMIVETGGMKPGARWLCSFSRYDYTRGRSEPVLSSTSPHAKCSFHRQEEWRPIGFPGG